MFWAPRWVFSMSLFLLSNLVILLLKSVLSSLLSDDNSFLLYPCWNTGSVWKPEPKYFRKKKVINSGTKFSVLRLFIIQCISINEIKWVIKHIMILIDWPNVWKIRVRLISMIKAIFSRADHSLQLLTHSWWIQVILLYLSRMQSLFKMIFLKENAN